nr:MAG TPA: hypothetical protein [Caudoviricetes sp.]
MLSEVLRKQLVVSLVWLFAVICGIAIIIK